MIILFVFLALLILLALTIIIGRMKNARKYKITSEKGIQTSEYITLGGIQQYIQIRGQNISNPIMIVLHGGPGSNMVYYSYDWQSYFEKDYTIVHWDQRGCGNTYYNNKEADKPTLDLLLSDLDQLVDYIRLEYDKEKVIIMGHSWGTFLGGIYSGEHPHKVSAYISVSQMLDFKKSELVSAEEAIRIANSMGKREDALEIEKQLEKIMSYQNLDKANARAFMQFRQLKDKYLPSGEELSLMKTLFLRFLSPSMSFHDLKWMFHFEKMIEVNSKLYESLLSDGKLSMYDYRMEYEISVIMIAGNCDWITPHSMAQCYFNDITAPRKEFITMENAGHIPFLDKSKKFSALLLKSLSNV